MSPEWWAVTIAGLSLAAWFAQFAYGDPWGYAGIALALVAAVVALFAVGSAPGTKTAVLALVALAPLALTIFVFYLVSRST